VGSGNLEYELEKNMQASMFSGNRVGQGGFSPWPTDPDLARDLTNENESRVRVGTAEPSKPICEPCLVGVLISLISLVNLSLYSRQEYSRREYL
jgi:hypothetical protein